MKRAEFGAAALTLLAGCVGGAATSTSPLVTASRKIITPDGSGDFDIGPYHFKGPQWQFGRGSGWGYSIWDTSKPSANAVGVITAWPWNYYDQNYQIQKGVKVSFLWDCNDQNWPPQNCSQSWTLHFGFTSPQLDHWLKGQIVKIFGNLFHVGQGVPDGCGGGTLRDPAGNPLWTMYVQDNTTYYTQFHPFQRGEGPWILGGSGPDLSSTCVKGVVTFIGGLAAGIGGCLTTEFGVGLLGVIAGGTSMISGAVDIRDGCR